MQLENLNEATRTQIFDAHMGMTQTALVQVFGKTESEAARLAQGLWSRFRDAPRQEQNLLLHNDPLALACDLAEGNWSDIDETKLARFNEARRTIFGVGQLGSV